MRKIITDNYKLDKVAVIEECKGSHGIRDEVVGYEIVATPDITSYYTNLIDSKRTV